MESHSMQSVKARLSDLEAKVRALRSSRRVLLTLLRQSSMEIERQTEMLVMEVKSLRKRNRTYARLLWEQNQRLVRLQQLTVDRQVESGE